MLGIFMRDSMYAIARICHASSVCHQGSSSKSDGFTPNVGAKYKGVAIFDQYAAMSWKGY